MTIEFRKISDFKRGTLLGLLKSAYSFDHRFEDCFIENWTECDNFFYDNIDIGNKYCLVSVLNDEPIGFICWDPRNMPEYVEIGHNCISTEHKGLGFGKVQLKEALSRITKHEIEKVIVTTNELLIPAQRNYEGVGFQFVIERVNDSEHRFSGDYIDYELVLE